jgi:tRNA/rRNA methyltransferase
MNLARLRIVLVRPKYSGNIGAVARAMRNFGVEDLMLVNPAPIRRDWADAMAVHARDVLDSMQVRDSVRAAVSECGLVVGTTCRAGLYREGARFPEVLAPEIAAALKTNRVAFVFGREDSGLTNEDLRCCHKLLTIPADPACASLNMAQAVLLCCYTVFRAVGNGPTEDFPAVPTSLAAAERQELMYERLKVALLQVGFLHRDNPDHIMHALRRILGRAGLEDRDVRIFLGIAHQIDWYAEGGWRFHEQPRSPLS